MRAGELDLYIERGCDWERILTIYKQTGSPVDLTGVSVEMQIRQTAQESGVICTPEIEVLQPGIEGRVRIRIGHEETEKLPAVGRHYKETAKCVYDVFIRYFSTRERILNGFIEVSPEVTR